MADYPRCATCKHWQKDDGWDQTDLAVGGTARICELAQSRGAKYHDKTRAVAMDGEGYLADLITWPDFGCVQHEAKDRG